MEALEPRELDEARAVALKRMLAQGLGRIDEWPRAGGLGFVAVDSASGATVFVDVVATRDFSMEAAMRGVDASFVQRAEEDAVSWFASHRIAAGEKPARLDRVVVECGGWPLAQACYVRNLLGAASAKASA